MKAMLVPFSLSGFAKSKDIYLYDYLKDRPIKMEKFSEYKVVHIVEGGCGTIFLGASGLPVQKIESEFNMYAQDGWQVVFQVVEQKRFMLFWKREALVVTLGR